VSTEGKIQIGSFISASYSAVVRRNCIGQQLTPLGTRIDAPVIDLWFIKTKRRRLFDAGSSFLDQQRFA
jgi:hypothetical protein